jgi:tRNA (adenine57-N1/adenine58-N1)-methyltransferase
MTVEWSGIRRGPLQVGERVRLTDPKGRHRSVVLDAGATYFTHKGAIAHDDMIGEPDGTVVTSSGGVEYLVQRPLLADSVVAMPRGAAVIYPKDAAQILTMADIFPGARVVEAGAGSGALSCSLLRMIGPSGRLVSHELREDFAEVARRNVTEFFGGDHPAWDLRVGDLAEFDGHDVDRMVLDMLAPWEFVRLAASALAAGGIVCAYVATTPQLSRFVEALRADGGFTEPEAWETLVRRWHVEGLAVRPDHKMSGHTGFLATARKLAPGVRAPRRTRRPAPGAYGPDYTGPRPDEFDARHPEMPRHGARPGG